MKKYLYWIPRVLSILFILFISMFALDVFSEGYSFGETIIALFMHLIPSFALIVITIIAWKKEYVGAALFMAIAIFYIVMFWSKADIIAMLLIAGPPMLIGILYILNKLSSSPQALSVGSTDRARREQT